MTVIDTRTAARQLGVTLMALNRYLRLGYLPSARQLVNGYWIVTQEAVDKFIVDRAMGKFPRKGPKPRKHKQL